MSTSFITFFLFFLLIGTSAICPCTPLIDLWYKISNNHPEFSIKIVSFAEKHADTLTTLQTNNTNIDFIMTPCDSKNWLKNLNFLKITDTKFVNCKLYNLGGVLSINNKDNENHFQLKKHYHY